jgi:hypothetical protein
MPGAKHGYVYSPTEDQDVSGYVALVAAALERSRRIRASRAGGAPVEGAFQRRAPGPRDRHLRLAAGSTCRRGSTGRRGASASSSHSTPIGVGRYWGPSRSSLRSPIGRPRASSKCTRGMASSRARACSSPAGWGYRRTCAAGRPPSHTAPTTTDRGFAAAALSTRARIGGLRLQTQRRGGARHEGARASADGLMGRGSDEKTPVVWSVADGKVHARTEIWCCQSPTAWW